MSEFGLLQTSGRLLQVPVRRRKADIVYHGYVQEVLAEPLSGAVIQGAVLVFVCEIIRL